MKKISGVVAAALVSIALSGCTAALPGLPFADQTSSADPQAERGSGVGNARPSVGYDGLMVRRRVVIAVHPSPGADVARLRAEMDRAAARRQLVLTDMSPDVLDAGLLEHLVPKLTLALPAGGTLDDARELVDPAFYPGWAFPGVDHFHVASVLVHDLRFEVASDDPAAVTEYIAREGILSDALGTYETRPGHGELDVTYTGPLLSDDLIQSIRVGIARGADTRPAAVAIEPRSTLGVGVDMAREPAQVPATTESATAHGHGDELAAVDESSVPVGPWALYFIGVAGLLVATLVLLTRKFRPRPSSD